MMRMLDIRQIVMSAVCLIGRRNDYSHNGRISLAGLQHIPRPLNVDLKRIKWIIYRLVDDRLRGKMEHGIDIVPAEYLIQEREIANVAARDNNILVHPFALEQPIFVLFVYQNDGLRSALDEFGNNMTA